MGPSGEPTLLNIMGLLDGPTSGRVYMEGRDVTELSDEEASRLRSRRIGLIFQMFNLTPWLTALENVELAASIAGAPRRGALRRARELLEMVGLGHRLHHKPTRLSGGEQHRVAGALVNDSSVVLADEPTGALDAATGRRIVELLRGLTRRGVTMIVGGIHDGVPDHSLHRPSHRAPIGLVAGALIASHGGAGPMGLGRLEAPVSIEPPTPDPRRGCAHRPLPAQSPPPSL